MRESTPTSVTLSPVVRQILDDWQERLGGHVSRSALVNFAILKLAGERAPVLDLALGGACEERR